MKTKHPKYSLLMLLLPGMFSPLLAGQDEAGITFEALSRQQAYKVSLHCNKPFSVGKFEQCTLDVYQPDKTTAKLKNAKILLSGGMPAHHHGLPTSPVVSWSADKQTYLVEGLKFSMPGQWELRLLIETDNQGQGKTIQDKVLFTFTI
jgi:hypothetical protein